MTEYLQKAPYPTILEDLVKKLKYRPGWTCRLYSTLNRGQGSEGLTLIITTLCYDSYHPDKAQHYRVNHYMPVPPAAYDERSWRRTLFEHFLLVERQPSKDAPKAPSGRRMGSIICASRSDACDNNRRLSHPN